MSAAPPVPEEMHTIIPHITVTGCADAIEWYKRVFHAEERRRLTGPDGKILHTEIRIGDSWIMADDPKEGYPGGKTPAGVVLNVWHPEAEAIFARAVENGAKVAMPFGLKFWGHTYGMFTDPWGQTWGPTYEVEGEIAQEEMERRTLAALSSPEGFFANVKR